MPIAGSVKHCCWLAQEGRGRRSATFWILIKLYTHLACLSRENIRAIKGLVWKSSAGWSFLHAYATTIMKFERCASQHALHFLHVLFSSCQKICAATTKRNTLLNLWSLTVYEDAPWKRNRVTDASTRKNPIDPHFTLYALRFTWHVELRTLHLTLYTLHSTLYIPHSTLPTLHSTLCTLHFTLYTTHYTPHFTLHTLHFALYTPHYTLHTSHFALRTRHFTLQTPHSTLHTLHPRLYTLHYTVHNPHFTLYTLYSPLDTPFSFRSPKP